MLAPLRSNQRRQRVAATKKRPAPTKGWYTASAIAEAPLGTALVIDNWFCETDAIRLRKGSVEHADGLGTEAVESLLTYASGVTRKLFGACDGEIFDATAAGPVGAAVVSGLSNSRIQATNVATSGGQFLLCVNGEDDPFNYNGSAWDTSSGITGSGLTSSDLINVWQHQQRVWFVEDETTDAWYLAADAISGTATAFSVGSYLTRGGKLMAGASWSVDAGAGMDDLNVMVSSEGEIVVFAGTDPSDADAWSLQGVYAVGRPIGSRCLFKVGGDLIVMCEDGLLPMSKVIKVDKAVLSKASITRNINTAYTDAVKAYGGNFGWEIVTLPKANMALVNVPTAEGQQAEQHVMNTVTGAWSRFKNWDAVCWALFEDEIYYGAPNGTIFNAEKGSQDGDEAIESYVLPAYDDLGRPGVLKHVKLVKPIYASNVSVAPEIAVAVDYEDPGVGSAATVSGIVGFTWDVSEWDGDDLWAGTNTFRPWQAGSNIGSAISPATSVVVDEGGAANDLVYRLLAYHYVFEEGGFVGA